MSRVTVSTSSKFYHVIKDISGSSFGIYLCHMAVLRAFAIRLYGEYGTSWYVQMIVMTLSLVGAYIITKLLSNLPIKKYIIG